MLVWRGTSEMTRLPVANNGQLKEELDQRHWAEYKGGALLRGERLSEVKSRRITLGHVIFNDIGIFVIKVSVVTADFGHQIFEKNWRQIECLRSEGNRQDTKSLLGFGQVDSAAAVRSRFAWSTLKYFWYCWLQQNHLRWQ